MSEIIKIIDEKEMLQKTKTNKKKLRQKRTRGTEAIVQEGESYKMILLCI